MKNAIMLSLLSVFLFSASTTSHAQDFLLKHRSGLELNLGVWSGGASSSISTGGLQTEANLGAFIGGILYTNWLQENLSVTLSAGLLAAKANSKVSSMGAIEQQVSSVVPLLIGVRLYLPYPEPDAQVRPFLSAAIGPYIGSEAKSTLFTQGTHTETSFGGRAGVGIDFILGNHFKLGANAGYNVMSDFDASVGGRMNYNGGEFSIGIGYIF